MEIRNFLKFHQFIAKLQQLPETKKKIIIFVVVIIAGLMMGFFWIQSAKRSISGLGESLQSMDLPVMDFPKMEFPEETIVNEMANTIEVVSESDQEIINSEPKVEN